MPPAASDKKVLRLNMALHLDYFAIDFQSNRDIPRCRRLLPYYWQRSLCQAMKTAVHEVARAGVGGVMWQLLTPRDNVVQNRMVARHGR
jgi:D-alanyl-D-alanine dipeptidase